MISPQLIIVCAYNNESKMIRSKLNLSREHSDKRFPFYTNKEKNIHLIESGPGHMASAIATTYAFTKTGCHTHTFFCNIGIAGGEFPLGELFQIHKIIENETQSNYYPHFYPHLPSTELITSTRPSKNYQNNQLMDMEGSGFYQACSKFVNNEQISLIKIVSDNSSSPFDKINIKKCDELFERNANDIEKHLKLIIELSKKENQIYTTPYLEEIIKLHHFTQYQKEKLHGLCLRAHALIPHINLLTLANQNKNAQNILHAIETKLNRIAVQWS